MAKNILYSKKGEAMAKVGVDLGVSAIFILAIGLTITTEVINNVSLTGITATVASYAPLIIVAGFIFFVSRIFGII